MPHRKKPSRHTRRAFGLKILLPYHRPRVGNQTGKLVKLERLVQDMIGLLVDRFGQVLVSGHDDDVNPEQPLFAADVL